MTDVQPSDTSAVERIQEYREHILLGLQEVENFINQSIKIKSKDTHGHTMHETVYLTTLFLLELIGIKQ